MKNGPYELIIAPDNFPGKKYRGRYAYEHIVIFWKAHGYVPEKGLEIHHKNMNHRDNRITNLKLVTGQEHRKLHGEIRSKAAIRQVPCGYCGNIITMRNRDLNMKIKANKKGKAFCDRSCGAKNQHSSVP